MDRHVKWLRRRILASIATQTAETFAVVAVLAFVLMQWLTSEGPLTALFGSVVIAQLVAAARIGHAMRSNPLNYVFMRKYVERPFAYRVSRFQGEDVAHPVAQELPGFVPVATIRDSDADPEPIFDIYNDPSRLVAASVSRASGSVSLISSLANGRLLITDARLVPPHERLVMSLAADDRVETVIATHRRALSGRSDVMELVASAHQVVLDSLALEFDSHVALGPALSPFLDLEASSRSPLRLIARIKPKELVSLPARLGPDLPVPSKRTDSTAKPTPVMTTDVPLVVAPDMAATQSFTTQGPANQAGGPQVVAPQIAQPEIAQPEIAQPEIAHLDVAHLDVAQPDGARSEIVAPDVTVPMVTAPQIVAAEELFAAKELVAAPAVAETVIDAPSFAAPAATDPTTPVPTTPVPIVAQPVVVEPVAAYESSTLVTGEAPPLEPVVVSLPEVPLDSERPEPPTARPDIAPSHFVTVEPDRADVLTSVEPITAEVPIVDVTPVMPVTPVTPPAPERPLVNEPLDLQAALAALPNVPVIDNVAPPIPAEAPAPSPLPQSTSPLLPIAPISETGAEVAPASEPAPEPPRSIIPNEPRKTLAPASTLAPAATLAEAVVAAPDNPSALTDGLVAKAPPALTETVVADVVSTATHTAATHTAAPSTTASASAASNFVSIPSALQPGEPRQPQVASEPQDLATALGYSGSSSRPRLSAVLRSNADASAEAKRSRRKHR